MHALDEFWNEHLLADLERLDSELVEVDGTLLKPSQCYHIGENPTHVLFNTNCPQVVKEKVTEILARYRF